MKKPVKKLATGFLRLGIGLGIILFLLFKINLKDMLAVLRESLSQWPWLVLAVALYMVALWIGIGRWKIILDAQGLRMAWSRVFCVSFIGQFFNSFMFGSTGGDLARAYYAAKETHHKKTEAAATVVIDRMVGLVVLNFIAGVMLVARFDFYRQHWSTHLPALFMIGMIAATILAVLVVFNIRFFKGWPIFRFIEHHPTLGPFIRRMLISIYLYRRRTKILLKTAVFSFAIHFLIVVQCYCLGKSLQINISLLDYLTVIPLIISLAALPITPGGLGIREGLAVTMLGAMGVSASQALPLSLMLYFMSVILSLAGGFIFLGYTAGAGHTVHDEIVEIEEETAGEDRQIRVPGSHE
ncbi:MAG: lysylphosphatidylglycerol synthase transmembrane domain-containing protein [Kiritimatiellia bacterium]|nr:lysylphosphatidylglycerol synthase transmembrane domain-containing protein [Kiritimatiellia bacterium]